MKFNFQYWVRKYAEDYHKDTGGKYPLYVDARGVKKTREVAIFRNNVESVAEKRIFVKTRISEYMRVEDTEADQKLRSKL
jgi:hypothetical protein